MGGNGTAQFAYQSPDLVKVLNAARKGNFKVRIPAKNGAVPPEVAAGLNQVFAVNQRMAQELEELRRERKDLLRALEAFEEGDFAARAAEGPSGSPVVRALNNVIGMNQKVAGELVRVSRAVGKEGRLFERAVLKKARGSWGTSIAAVNTLIGDLVQPTIEVASVIGEVAEGLIRIRRHAPRVPARVRAPHSPINAPCPSTPGRGRGPGPGPGGRGRGRGRGR